MSPSACRLLLPLALVSGVLGGCATEPAGDDERKPPNILLVSIDTLRADRLGCYGGPAEISPFLDQVAASGVRFRHAFVNTHGTTPSHATMLSSLYQESHRVAYGATAPGTLPTVPEEILLLPEALSAAGYLTVGVAGGGNVAGKLGFTQGFDRFDDRARSVTDGTARLLELLREVMQTPATEPPRPIFAFYHTYEVHSPYATDERYRGLLDESASGFEPTTENLLRHVHSAKQTLSPDDLDFIRASYDAGVRFTDAALRQLHAGLGELGFLDHAVVVVTSDHGEEFGEHGGLLHRDVLFDEILHVPLIVAGSGIGQSLVDDRMVSLVDVAPTILGCAGVAVPVAMAGRDLLCAGGSPEAEAFDAVISQYGPQRYAVRTREWKLIEATAPPAVELYDLASDPGETRNVAADNRRVVADLRQRLATWRDAQQPVEAADVEVELSPEEVERLKALGYLGD